MKNEKPQFGSAAEVMAYVDERLDAIAHRLRALTGAMRWQNVHIANGIATECHRIKYALTFVQGAPPPEDPEP